MLVSMTLTRLLSYSIQNSFVPLPSSHSYAANFALYFAVSPCLLRFFQGTGFGGRSASHPTEVRKGPFYKSFAGPKDLAAHPQAPCRRFATHPQPSRFAGLVPFGFILRSFHDGVIP